MYSKKELKLTKEYTAAAAAPTQLKSLSKTLSIILHTVQGALYLCSRNLKALCTFSYIYIKHAEVKFEMFS